jgi:hypothetical protein
MRYLHICYIYLVAIERRHTWAAFYNASSGSAVMFLPTACSIAQGHASE